jgi:hypothetical protein
MSNKSIAIFLVSYFLGVFMGFRVGVAWEKDRAAQNLEIHNATAQREFVGADGCKEDSV